MSTEKSQVIRQWVSMPGGSCDLRVGEGAIAQMGAVLKGSVGRPRVCLLVADADAPASVVEDVRRQLTDTGFVVSRTEVAGGAQARTLAAVEALSTELVAAKVTSDDLVCAVGGTDALSLCAFVSASWCGGTPLVHVPCDLLTSVIAATTPLGMDVAGAPEMLVARTGAKYELCDLLVVRDEPSSAASLHARALMAAAALADSEASVQRLWDRADLLVDGDVETLRDQLADTAKSRGHIVSSTSIAVRQSIGFGQTFMRAASTLVGPEVPQGLLLAEGLRFQARIAAASGQLSVDDVLTIDELLDLLGLEPVSCEVNAEQLVEALRADRFLHSNRFILNLPRAIGRVRPGSVEEDVLREHVAAWCASRASA